MGEKISPLGHQHGEVVTSTNPLDGYEASFIWDGKSYVYRPNPTSGRQEQAITSSIDAVIITRRISKNGGTQWIKPCNHPDWDAKLPHCRYKGGPKESLCQEPEGLIIQEGVIYCPLQRGVLTLVTSKKN